MKIGILGLPQSGRRTVYGLLTGSAPPAEGEGKGPVIGVAPILDPRFDDLAARYRPKKETRARFTLELLPALEENAVREGAVFSDIAGTDALLLVVREFEDDRVYHPKGSVDPARDVDAMVSELLLHDLIFIEKRLERIAEGKRRGRDERAEKEEPLMAKMRGRLEGDLPLRTMELSDEERKLVSGYPLITMKELVVALNAGEGDMKGSGSVESIGRKYEGHGITVARLSARLEAEIASLDSLSERAEFMKESGIEEPALSLLTRSCMAALGLQSFFTVGDDEVRQWLVRRGATAPEAAGAIHSDIQRGFIRAEVTKYSDLVALGSEEAVKRAGKALVMGRDYLVEDGDIISFRFNV